MKIGNGEDGLLTVLSVWLSMVALLFLFPAYALLAWPFKSQRKEIADISKMFFEWEYWRIIFLMRYD